jgi:hypothetical protein
MEQEYILRQIIKILVIPNDVPALVEIYFALTLGSVFCLFFGTN